MKLIKAARWVKYSVTFGLFLAITALVLFLYYLPEEKILRLFIAQSEMLLDRKVQIEDFRYTINGFRLNGVRIIEKDGSSSYLQARAIEIRFNRRSFLQRKIDISSFTIHDLQITIDYSDEYSVEPVWRSIEKNISKFSFFTEGGSIPRLNLKNLIINIKNTQPGLTPLVGEYHIHTRIDVKDENVRFGKLRLVLPARRGTMISEGLTLSLEKDDFALTGDLDLTDCDLFWVYGFGENVKLPYRIVNGAVKDLKVTGKYTEGYVENTSCTLSNGNNVFAQKGYTRVTYEPLTLLLKNITATAQGTAGTRSSIEIGFIEVEINTQKFSFNVGPVEGEIGDYLTMIPVFDQLPLTGFMKASLVCDKTKFTGNFGLRDFAFGTILTGLTTDLEIRQNMFHVEALQANFFGMPARISAKPLNNTLTSFAMNIDYDNYVFDEHMENEIGLPPGISIQGTVKAKSVVYQKQTIHDANLAYRLDSEMVSIPRARCRFLGADIDGEATIGMTEQNPKTTVFMRFFNLPAQNLGDYTEAVKNRLYGSASGQLKAELYPGKKTPPSGSVSFTIVNGKVVNTGFQNQLGFLLNPLRYKLEDLEFSHIYGNILFDSKGYHFSSFVFDAPEISLRMNGSVSTANIGNLDITLRFTDAFIRDIPNIFYVAPQFASHRRNGVYTYNLAIQDKDIFGKDSVKMLP